MAILKDIAQDGITLQFIVTNKDPRPDQGCAIHTLFSEYGVIYEAQFGWTNYTLNKFIEALTQFPLKAYEGYFSHSDETLEIKWFLENKTGLYLLVLFISGRVLSMKVSAEDIHSFGLSIVSEINSPKAD